MAKVNFSAIQTKAINTQNHKMLDTVWLLSSTLEQATPGWEGSMSAITQGPCICSNNVFNQIVPLNTSTNEAVYNTMLYIDQQRSKVGQCCDLPTFNQPLYTKAHKIKQENIKYFLNMQLYLGRFHLLVSFLGTGCKYVEN